MILEEKITNLIEPTVENLGYELVRVKQINQDNIQIMIDATHRVIDLSDCEKVTKLIGPILYVEGISENYGLEVSSPGLDRPLTKPHHFTRFLGSRIKVTTNLLLDGQKRFVGELVNFDPENHNITLQCENKTVEIKLDQILTANLVFDLKKAIKK